MGKKGLEMYFNPDVAERFADLEQNEKNFNVAKAIDQVVCGVAKKITQNFKAAELGGGAHPDRYHTFFEKLKNKKGSIDWVDVSPYMLDLAKSYIDSDNYQDRLEVINFVNKDILNYLDSIDDNFLDLAIMKYTIDHIKQIDKLFSLLSKKLKKGGVLVSSLGVTSPELKSISTNARFLYNGKEFPKDETRKLKDGDRFTIKFFKKSGDPSSGYLKGAKTTKYYHSIERYKKLAQKYSLDIYLGDRKELIDGSSGIDQEVMVLTNKS